MQVPFLNLKAQHDPLRAELLASIQEVIDRSAFAGGTFVEIQKGSKIGNRCKISSHTFICEGVTLEDEVFVGHGVIFTNDLYPQATNINGSLQTEADWKCIKTLVKRGAAIGSGATLLCGITIGERALVGAGSVVTKDVPAGAVVAGNPARVIKSPRGEKRYAGTVS